MLYFPILSPDRASKRFPGGIRRSSNRADALICRNLRKALYWMSGGNFRDNFPFHIFSVSLQEKEVIIDNGLIFILSVRTYAQDQRNRVSSPDFADEIGDFSFRNPVSA